jgi:prepilin-type N-terminal cleavage/methylation domain-containing protein
MLHGEEAGYSLIELAVVSIIVGLAASILMPSIQGYQGNEQTRTVALQAVAQFRQAQMSAMALDQEINVLFDPTADLPSRGNTQGYEFCLPSAACGFSATWSTSDPAMIKNVIPNSVKITAYCYRGAFTPTGQYLNWTGVCPGAGASIEALCFDGGGQKFYLTIQVATGEVSLSAKQSGSCP